MRRKASSTARGYGATHRAYRRQWAPRVAAGLIDCARCGKRIYPGEAWDLGHVDGSRKRVWSGPEHRTCNRRAGAELTNAGRRNDRRRYTSRDWGADDPDAALGELNIY